MVLICKLNLSLSLVLSSMDYWRFRRAAPRLHPKQRTFRQKTNISRCKAYLQGEGILANIAFGAPMEIEDKNERRELKA